MSYNKSKVVVLLTILLATLHSRPVAAWLRFYKNHEVRSSAERLGDLSRRIKNISEASTASYGDFPDYADATETFPPNHENVFLVPDTVNYFQNTSNDPESNNTILNDTIIQEAEDTLSGLENLDLEDLEDNHNPLQEPGETLTNPVAPEDTYSHDVEDAVKHSENSENVHSHLQDTDEDPDLSDSEDPENDKSSSLEAEESASDSEDSENTRRPSQNDQDHSVESTEPQQGVENRSHAFGLFLRQLGPLIFQAFFSSVTTVIFNWFYPFKVVPPPPGLVGVSQLWGGLPHPHHWKHHWGHLHLGPGKWGNGNWGHAYWGPAYSGHTPPAPPARPWEPHPHAHL